MATTTSAGSTIAISPALPGAETEAGYGALTFTDIGQVEKIGSIGAVYAKTEFQPLFGPKMKFKGSADFGSLQPSLAHDESDAGQAILRAAADSPDLFSFRVTYPTGAKRYFEGRVFGYPETTDVADAMLLVTPTIEICTKVVKVGATGAIVLPTVSISGALSKSEGNSGTLAFTYIVTLSQAAGSGGVAVPWALAYGSTDSADFASGQATSGTLTIAAGQTSGMVTINAVGDTTLEGDETFTFLISTPTGYLAGAATSATGTILNDDAPPAPTFSSLPSISPTSGTAGTTTFAATDGVATNATSISRRWLLGTTSIGTGATVVAPTGGQLTLENTAAGPGGSKTVTSGAVTVAAQAAPTLSISAAVAQNEGNSGTTAFAWTLTLNRDGSTDSYPFNWAVTGSGANPASASDFGGVFPSGSGTFAAGETSKTILVLATGDTAVESNETFTLTVDATGLNTVTSTGTISNDDAAGPTLSMTQLTDARIFQRSTTTGSANSRGAGAIAVPITLDGVASTVEYRLRDAVAGGNPTLQDWTTAASNVAAGSSVIICPNVPARLGWYYVDLRANGGTAQLGTARVGMGRVVAVAGQSLAVRMFTTRDSQTTVTMASLSVAADANTSIFGEALEAGGATVTPVWGQSLDGTTGYNSTFAAEFSRRQVAASGVNCALVGFARGSQSISVFVPGGADSANLRGVLDAVGGFETFIWMQGHTDAKNGVSSASYQASLTNLFTDITSHNAVRGASYDKILGSIPNINSTVWGTPAQIQAIRNAQATWAAANGGVTINANDLDLYDGVHQSQAGSITLARHFYRASRVGLGMAHSDAGPNITSATRAAGSQNVVLSITLPSGATGLASVGAPASRFSVFATGTTTPALGLDTTTPIAISGSTITLKLASAPADGQALDVHVFYPPDATNAGQTNMIYDSSTDSDGITVGRQLTATLAPVVAAAPSGVTKVGPDLAMANGQYQAGRTNFGQELFGGGYGFSPAATDLMSNLSTFTLECVIATSATPSTLRVFAGQNQRGFIGINSSGRLVGGFNNKAATAGATTYLGTSTGSTAGANPVINDGARHHIAMVCTPTGATLYLDGVQVATSSTALYVGPGLDKFGIANFDSATTATYLFTGSVDEVAVWNIAKYTAAFTAPTTPYVGTETGLIGLYHLDGNGNAATY